jgi:hypothetical protein
VTSADLTFDPVAHKYRLPDGRLVPSVTQILGAVGVAVDFDLLAGLSHRVEQAIDLKRDVGRALHADAHSYDDDDLDWATVDPRVRPYLQAWATFRENTGLAPLTRERLVYHPIYGYGGHARRHLRETERPPRARRPENGRSRFERLPVPRRPRIARPTFSSTATRTRGWTRSNAGACS